MRGSELRKGIRKWQKAIIDNPKQRFEIVNSCSAPSSPHRSACHFQTLCEYDHGAQVFLTSNGANTGQGNMWCILLNSGEKGFRVCAIWKSIPFLKVSCTFFCKHLTIGFFKICRIWYRQFHFNFVNSCMLFSFIYCRRVIRSTSYDSQLPYHIYIFYVYIHLHERIYVARLHTSNI